MTFTCNPKSQSIAENLPTGVNAENRPDLVTRVFNRQLHELLYDIKHRHILGKPVAMIYVIEFQKRGLPHCHMLIVLDHHSKLRDKHDIDSIISAEMPVNLPFVLQRRQFPVRLAYSMTINKAQGQTFDKLGIHLPAPVFSHGQLYVAFSRAKAFKDIHVNICETTTQGRRNNKYITQNVVYPEVL